MLAAAVGGTDPAPFPTQGGAPQQPGLQHPALHPTCLIPIPFLPVRRSSRAIALSQLCHGAGRGWTGSPRSPQALCGAGHLGACMGHSSKRGAWGDSKLCWCLQSPSNQESRRWDHLDACWGSPDLVPVPQTPALRLHSLALSSPPTWSPVPVTTRSGAQHRESRAQHVPDLVSSSR